MRGVAKNSNKYWDSWHRPFKVSFFLFTYVVTAEAYWHDPSLVKALVKNKHKFRFFRRWNVNTTLSGFWTNYGTLLETNYCQLSGGLISDIQASQPSQALSPHNSGLLELLEGGGGVAPPDFDSIWVNPISTGGFTCPPRIVKSSYGSAH